MSKLDETQIECAVERMTDRVDQRYMNGDFNEVVYKEKMREIDTWANSQYDLIRK